MYADNCITGHIYILAQKYCLITDIYSIVAWSKQF